MTPCACIESVQTGNMLARTIAGIHPESKVAESDSCTLVAMLRVRGGLAFGGVCWPDCWRSAYSVNTLSVRQAIVIEFTTFLY